MNEIIAFDTIDKDGPQRFRATFDDLRPEDLGRIEVTAVGPVTIEGTIAPGNTPAEYVADGSMQFTADFSCVRCLEPYPFAHSSTFHVRFQPRPEPVGEEEEEIEIAASEELDVEFYSERSIAVRELALEQVQLAIPMKPLCSESCLGLCPQCGENRNREACSCATSITDERWSALREIRTELSKKRES